MLETGGGGDKSALNSTFQKRRLLKPDMDSSLANNSSSVDDPSSITSDQMIERIVATAAQLSSNDLVSINIVEKLMDEINREMSNKLIKMVNLTSTHVVESNLIDNNKINRTTGIENNPKFLCQLIELTFEQFKCMARLYKYFIECSLTKLSSLSVNKYQWSNVWTCIQNVLIQLLDEYLDIKQLNQAQSNADLLEKTDINSFFAKKRLINLTFGESEPTISESEIKDNHRIFTFKGKINLYICIVLM